MKIATAALVAFSVFAGAAQAHAAGSYFDDLSKTAPRAPFDQIQDTAPRSVFDDLADSAPRSYFDVLGETAPRSANIDAPAQQDLASE